MSYKKLETMRQVRLFITEIIIPTAGIVVLVATNDELREGIKTAYNKGKQWTKEKAKEIKGRFTKKEEWH